LMVIVQITSSRLRFDCFATCALETVGEQR
jgi:hypothetical protein